MSLNRKLCIFDLNIYNKKLIPSIKKKPEKDKEKKIPSDTLLVTFSFDSDRIFPKIFCLLSKDNTGNSLGRKTKQIFI